MSTNYRKLTEYTANGALAAAPVIKVMQNAGWKVGKNFFAKPVNRGTIPAKQTKGK